MSSPVVAVSPSAAGSGASGVYGGVQPQPSPSVASTASPTSTVSSPSNAAMASPASTDSNAQAQQGQQPQGGWIAAFGHNSDPAKVPGEGQQQQQVAVAVQEEIPQAVSEEAQERQKNEEYAKAQTGFFKQNLAKLKSNLCGPLHVGDALFSAWCLMWFIIAGTTKGDIKYFWLVIAFLFYGSYLSWNWKSDERLFVWDMMTVNEFEDYWKGLRASNPIISMKTESWHWERRVHTSTTYHAGGGSTTTTTVTYVRRVTHTEVEVFQYSLCEDLSLDVEGSDLQKDNATFVHLWKEYLFGTMQTALAYHSQLMALKSRNQSRDAFMDTFEYMDIPGWKRVCGVYRNADARPILLRGWIFISCCVCLMSWPIKIYMEFVSKKGGFTMRKRVHV